MVETFAPSMRPEDYQNWAELEGQLAQDPSLAGAYTEFERQADMVTSSERGAGVERTERIASIPHSGFESEQQQRKTDEIINALRFPLDNITSINHAPNDEDTEGVLGSFGVAEHNRGELILYGLNDEQPPEQQFRTHAHEVSHSVEVQNPKNDEIYVGAEKREAAAALARNIAAQSLVTETFMNGYHKKLAQMHSEGEITFEHFTEEVHAIALEYGQTNRRKLEEIQDVQLHKMADLDRAGQLPEGIQPVYLISHEDSNGEMQVDGIDQTLIQLIDGVDSHEELVDHVANLKQRFYGSESAEVASDRNQEREAQIIDIRKRDLGEQALRHLFIEDSLAA